MNEEYTFDSDLLMHHRDPHMQCPVNGCSTYLQPDAHEGTLVMGCIAHLQTVHRISEPSARVLAERAVKQHVPFVKTLRKTRGE